MEKHVTSLELSKKLKELGVPQESESSWYETVDCDDIPRLSWTDENRCRACTLGQQPWEKKYSAFLSSELGELLPEMIEKDETMYWIMYTHRERKDHPDYSWTYCYADVNRGLLMSLDPRSEVFADTECNARAQMLIYLIEQKLSS